MANKNYLDKSGLSYFWGKIKSALSGKQDALVSGTNIKTVNNQSLLGSGNITIQGGGGTQVYSGYTLRYYYDNSVNLSGETIKFTTVKTDGSYFKAQYGSSNYYVRQNNSKVEIYFGVNAQGTLLETLELNDTYTLPVDFGVIGYVNGDLIDGITNRTDYTEYNIDQKQDSLVSGTNIKTINNTSLLGSGNITVSADDEIAISITQPINGEKIWINPNDLPSGSLNPITNTYSVATDKGYSCNYVNGIVESGSNENGNWIKYIDGTMICTVSKTLSVAATNAWGNYFYRGGASLGNWPQEFIDIPVISVVNATDTGGMIVNVPGTTKTSIGEVFIGRPTSSTFNCLFNVTGIGRWKQ